MPRKSDARRQMVRAAKDLIRERGYHATAFADVLDRSGAPRGSVYHHFPEGKSQLTIAAADLHGEEQIEYLDDAAEKARDAQEFLLAYVHLARDGMAASGYSRGCGIAPLVIEAGDELGDDGLTSRRNFAKMIDRVAFHLAAFGLDSADARLLAEATVAGLEGAMITARAGRDTAPFDAVGTVLAAQLHAVAPNAARHSE
ncbi:TetR/AcrR family transcriptional regulator [Actinoplanes sp. NPDC051411]|uniref:TetR/AcrR family transcriptional regulator n=1 Tax=Actinoplanes sp. NPDC051411 TaxID=3155522 RepID=UPI003449822F